MQPIDEKRRALIETLRIVASHNWDGGTYYVPEDRSCEKLEEFGLVDWLKDGDEEGYWVTELGRLVIEAYTLGAQQATARTEDDNDA